MDLTDLLEIEVKNTVGYSEASNKKLFMVGANVGILKSTEHYNKIINGLNTTISHLTKKYDEVSSDMNTLTDIIEKYKHHE